MYDTVLDFLNKDDQKMFEKSSADLTEKGSLDGKK